MGAKKFMAGIALALRAELYLPEEILEFSKTADVSSSVSHLFFPDIPGAQESLELCSAALAGTNRIKIGSGVLRPFEHDPKVFSRRIATIQWLSRNRFVLGIGTGSPSSNPKETIESMFSSLDEIRRFFPANLNGLSLTFPNVFVAALRSRMAVISADRGGGVLLNFCSPEYASELVSQITRAGKNAKVIVACYVKIFYSKDESRAQKLAAEEFVKYDRLPQYHAMFGQDGVAEEISSLAIALSKKESFIIPDALKKISLINPSSHELSELIEKFRKSGVNLPCIYPYFSRNENREFRRQVIEEIASLD
jgi:alkanesulfonate monooxygenase SsuD/methylene tetrahydromethanopterin reductase-like flavin-dependent oxidoreductase (luciferase family)